jgi:hypothetical protein
MRQTSWERGLLFLCIYSSTVAYKIHKSYKSYIKNARVKPSLDGLTLMLAKARYYAGLLCFYLRSKRRYLRRWRIPQ